MTLGDKQRLFAHNIGRLLVWCYANDYEVTFGEAERPVKVAALYAQQGIGVANSLHTKRLAIDVNLFLDSSLEADEDIYRPDSEAYRPLGEYWKSLHSLNRWGGDFKKPDGNHFSMEHEGVK